MSTFKTKRLVETALLLAMATVLSLFQPFQLPYGGGITIVSMLPIVLISYRYGVKWGFFSAFIGSILQMLTGMSTVSAMFLPGEGQMVFWKAILICLIDYIIAYTALGLGGIFRNRFKSPTLSLCLGAVVALFARFVAHIISGAIFFGSYAEWFFTQDGIKGFGESVLNTFSGSSLTIVYSIVYNATYMVPEIILTTIVAAAISRVEIITTKMDK